MAILLHIDTATEHASVCLTRDNTLMGLVESTEQKNHASFVQPAIARLLADSNYALNDIDAVAVTIGPGSYTGLRVGLASAKGICYALNKPLITLDTLQVMAEAAREDLLSRNSEPDPGTRFCPLIDARRMEVFTATYSFSLEETEAPHALIIQEQSFQPVYSRYPVIFSGSGAAKLEKILTDKNIFYSKVQHNASHMLKAAGRAYTAQVFADLAYCEPLYVKEFFDPSRPNG